MQLACYIHGRVFIVEELPSTAECTCCEALNNDRILGQCDCQLIKGNIKDKYGDLDNCAKVLRDIEKNGNVEAKDKDEEFRLGIAINMLFLGRCLSNPAATNNQITETGNAFLQGDIDTIKFVLSRRNMRI